MLFLFVSDPIYTASNCEADEPFAVEQGPSLHGEFPIGKSGRLILLPVEINGEKYQFLMDTGACRSGVDESLRETVGTARGIQLLQTPAGQKKVQTYDWPDVKIGGQSVKTEMAVACLDLQGLREAVNLKIFGIIGMDVLRNNRLQIDFDQGVLRFLETLPKTKVDSGVKIPLELADAGAPYLTASIGNETTERFLIDTGAHGNSLRSELFDELLERNQIWLGGAYSSVTVGGEVQGQRGRIRRMSTGSVTQEGIRVSSLNVSSLGLRYLARFQVILDFPGKAIYLRKGTHYLAPEPQATSGMSLNWIDGKIVVKSVKTDGPASVAGILPDDVLVMIDGKAASKYDHFSLRQLLTSQPGKKVLVQVRRGNDTINTELILDQD